MNRLCSSALVVSVCALVLHPARITACTPRAGDAAPDTFDLRITAELRALSPAAESLWVKANLARESGDHVGAAQLYQAVTRHAPTFYHAKRRLAMEFLLLDKQPSAVD